MRGVELSPASALVRPYCEAMFCTHDVGGQLAGVLVGARRTRPGLGFMSDEEWQPAINTITVTHVIARGISLAIGPWQDLGPVGEIGWPLFGHARAPLVVYVRNDAPHVRELRAVLVLHGDERRRSVGRRLRSSGL